MINGKSLPPEKPSYNQLIGVIRKLFYQLQGDVRRENFRQK